MKVQELLEAMDSNYLEAIIITPDYDDFTTTSRGIPAFYKNVSQSSYELYIKIKDYEVDSITGCAVDEISHKYWLTVKCKAST